MKKNARLLACNVFFVFALAFFCAPCFAQANGTEPTLEQVSAALAKNKTIRGNFTLERTAANKSRALKSSGEFVIASDYGIIWKTEKPIKSVQAVAKDFTVTETASGKRTKIDSSQNPVYLQMALLTSALWSGDLSAVKAAADLDFKSDKDSWTVELFPKDQNVKMALEKIVVAGTWSQAGAGQTIAAATSLCMRLKGGNAACYYMSGHKYDLPLVSAERSYFD